MVVVDGTDKVGKEPLLFMWNGLNMFLSHTKIRFYDFRFS